MKAEFFKRRGGIAPLTVALLLHAHAQLWAGWTPSNIQGTNNWSALAASADGTKLVAASYDDPSFNPGSIYTSTNSGTTWALTSAPSNFWYGVASSTNGDRLAAAVDGGGIYTSTDAGTTWVQATNAPYGVWYAIASSWDGNKLVAVSAGAARFIYTSPDTGQTWISNNVPDTEYWYAVASSADGQRLTAVSNSNTNNGPGAIYSSTDGGNNWISNKVAAMSWTGVSCSGDGQKLLACGSSSALYISADGGLNWKAVPGVFGYFTGTASSADGTRLVVVSNGGQIYTSTDSGANWVSNNAPALAWQEVTGSRDGNLVTAAVPGDQIYTSRSAPVLTFSANSGQGLLSWPWPSTGFSLQHNIDLATTNWQTTAKTPVLTNWQYQVMVIITNPQNYFRLKGP
jgi:photosystem II stability/assembly factor-like uncharacterized protein